MITIIGTAHISKDSVDEVREKINQLRPDVVAVELCEPRYKGLTEQRDIPILDLIKDKNSMFVITNILLSLLQRRLGEEVGIKPGREMLTAIDTAKEIGTNFALVDRDIGITLKRALSKMGFFEKLRAVKELVFAFDVSTEDLKTEVEELKRDEKITDVLKLLENVSPNLFQVMVRERDAYMAKKLLELQEKHVNVVAVVGAGHKRGIEGFLSTPEKIPPMSELTYVPEKRISVTKTLKYGIPALIIGIFAMAFYQGVSLEKPLLQWVLYNSIPTFLLVLLVGGSIVSAVVGMIAAPFTSLNPMIAAGWFAGVAEMKVRKVTVGDVSTAFKTTSFRELRKNNAFKVVLVTAFANIGSSIGTLVFIPNVLVPLVKSMFG
ncbi:TraB/GumN family protein [archaeon]|nr:TraB/GumN family protein [archaeon]